MINLPWGWEFSSGPASWTRCSHSRASGPTSGRGTKTLQVAHLSYARIFIVLSSVQGLLLVSGRYSVRIVASIDVFLMHPWREMNSTSTYSSATLNLPGWCRCTHCRPAGARCSCTRAPASCCCHSAFYLLSIFPPAPCPRERIGSAADPGPGAPQPGGSAPAPSTCTCTITPARTPPLPPAGPSPSPPPSPPPPPPRPEQAPGSLSSVPHCPLIYIFGFLVDILSR